MNGDKVQGEVFKNKIVIAVHLIFFVSLVFCIKKVYFDNGIESYIDNPNTTKQFIFLTFFFGFSYLSAVIFYSIKIINISKLQNK